MISGKNLTSSTKWNCFIDLKIFIFSANLMSLYCIILEVSYFHRLTYMRRIFSHIFIGYWMEKLWAITDNRFWQVSGEFGTFPDRGQNVALSGVHPHYFVFQGLVRLRIWRAAVLFLLSNSASLICGRCGVDAAVQHTNQPSVIHFE